MRRTPRKLPRLLPWKRLFWNLTAAAVALLAMGAAASAQGPNMREVSLVRQDFSDCPNDNVSDQDPSRVGGTVILMRNNDGTTTVKVGITASPNTKYNFFLKCVSILGTVQTYDEGEGEAQFSFRTDEASNVFAFDMYPDGAPAGNKFQSVQVRF
jgi:hypothetical protein